MVYRDGTGLYVDIRPGGVIGYGATEDEARMEADKIEARQSIRVGRGFGLERPTLYVLNWDTLRYEIVVEDGPAQ